MFSWSSTTRMRPGLPAAVPGSGAGGRGQGGGELGRALVGAGARGELVDPAQDLDRALDQALEVLARDGGAVLEHELGEALDRTQGRAEVVAQPAQERQVVLGGAQGGTGHGQALGDLAGRGDDPGEVAGLAAAARRLAGQELAIGEDGVGRDQQLLAQQRVAGAVAQQRLTRGHRAACGCRHCAIWTPCGWGGPAAGICCASAMTERITGAARGPTFGAAIPAMAANP